MGMPGAGAGVASVISYKAENIASLTQNLNNLLEAYNEANNNFITMMNSIVGSDAFAGAAAAAAGEVSATLSAAQTTANEKFNTLILGINNAANAASEADAGSAAQIGQG